MNKQGEIVDVFLLDMDQKEEEEKRLIVFLGHNDYHWIVVYIDHAIWDPNNMFLHIILMFCIIPAFGLL